MHIKTLPTCVAFYTEGGRAIGALFAASSSELPALTDLAHDLLPTIARWEEDLNGANNQPK